MGQSRTLGNTKERERQRQRDMDRKRGAFGGQPQKSKKQERTVMGNQV